MYRGSDNATSRKVAVMEEKPYFLTKTIKKPKPIRSITRTSMDFSYMKAFSDGEGETTFAYLLSSGTSATPTIIAIIKKTAAQTLRSFQFPTKPTLNKCQIMKPKLNNLYISL